MSSKTFSEGMAAFNASEMIAAPSLDSAQVRSPLPSEEGPERDFFIDNLLWSESTVSS